MNSKSETRYVDGICDYYTGYITRSANPYSVKISRWEIRNNWGNHVLDDFPGAYRHFGSELKHRHILPLYIL